MSPKFTNTVAVRVVFKTDHSVCHILEREESNFLMIN